MKKYLILFILILFCINLFANETSLLSELFLNKTIDVLFTDYVGSYHKTGVLIKVTDSSIVLELSNNEIYLINLKYLVAIKLIKK